MKKLKLLLTSILVLAVIFSFSACQNPDGDSDPIVGSWTIVSAIENGRELDIKNDLFRGEDGTIIFSAEDDGKCKLKESVVGMGSSSYKGSWVADGDEYICEFNTSEGKLTVSVEIKKDKLYFTYLLVNDQPLGNYSLQYIFEKD